MTPVLNARVEILKKFINIAQVWKSNEKKEKKNPQKIDTLTTTKKKVLRDINNYNGVMEILGGINTWAVQRLKNTWEAIPKEVLKTLEELDNLMENKQNYKAYRNALKMSSSQNQPTLPYLGKKEKKILIFSIFC
jgi:hypothetical protein